MKRSRRLAGNRFAPAVLGLMGSVAQLGAPASAADADPMALIAAAAVVDARCPQLAVAFGTLFQFAENHAIRTVDILPGGSRRDEFARRLAQAEGSGEPCTADAAQLDGAIPGLLTRR